MGNDDKNSGRYDYSNIDYLCVSGVHDKKVFSSALNARSSAFWKQECQEMIVYLM
ncbi:hypothetical protein V6R94_02420 [Pediococcus acidilactici]